MLKPAEEAHWTKRSAAHLLNRAGFGGNLEQIDQLRAMGRGTAVDYLLSDQDDTDQFAQPQWTAPGAVEELRRDFMAIRRINNDQSLSPEERDMARREAQRKQRLQQRKMTQESIELWFRRMLSSQAQTREKMTLFWHGHFATSVQKVKSPLLAHQ